MGLSSRFISFLRCEHREQQPEVDARDAAGDGEKRRHRVAEQRRARDRAAVAFRMAVRAPKRQRKQREERKQRIDNTFYQPVSVQNIEAGEKDKKSEYYDKIYIGWWDAAADYDGKLPYPYTEDVVIAEDWSSYFRPHTNLRLNNKILNKYRKV